MSFDQLGLSPALLRTVAQQGYTHPTAVQREAIPIVLAGRDILAGAQTGTGKTAAFVLPILQFLDSTPPRADGKIRVLVLAPTRELAIQVEESVRTYGAHKPRRSTVIYGGVGYPAQLAALRRRPEIVVATPGRLLDHAGSRAIDLSGVEILVLDEADRMLDMGFIRDIRKVIALLPARRQNLLFSATFSNQIRTLADGMLNNPAHVQVTPRNTPTDLVQQVVHPVDRERKRELLTHLVRAREIDQALVFTRTKHGANKLAEQLTRDGIASAAIHGNKSQPQRIRALNDFKQGRVLLLIATEVASRGLDIEALPHVVNYELPMVPADYVHRIGRTGRAGINGKAVSLVCVDETPLLRDIQRLLGQPIEQVVVPGFEPNREVRAEPIQLRSADHRGRRPQPRGGQPRGGQPRAAQPAPQHAGQAAGGQGGRPAAAGQRRRQRPGRRPASGSSIGNGWQRLPGERSAR